jgi:hypothetical protein
MTINKKFHIFGMIQVIELMLLMSSLQKMRLCFPFFSNLLGEKWKRHFGVDPNLSSATK